MSNRLSPEQQCFMAVINPRVWVTSVGGICGVGMLGVSSDFPVVLFRNDAGKPENTWWVRYSIGEGDRIHMFSTYEEALADLKAYPGATQ